MNITGYDFSGWATRPNLRCSDGRVIMRDAFKDDSGRKVPLVYNHIHDSMSQVLGHAILEEKDGGIYAYAFLNNSQSGNEAREAVKHGDITSFSIYANQLRENGKNVIHGMIRELSIVLAGANPGAVIEDVLAHNDDFDGEAIIDIGYDNADILSHADKEEEKPTEEKSKSEEKEEVAEAKEEAKEEVKEAPKAEESSKGKTVGEVFNTLNDDQKKAVAIIVGQAIAEAKEDKESDEDDDNDKEVSHSGLDDYDERNNNEMKYNVFENTNEPNIYLSKEDQKAIIQHAMESSSSLKQTVMNEMRDGGILAHAITDHNGNSVTYGVANIDYFFPDVKAMTNTPGLINPNQDWVAKVINGTHHTPFSRVKSWFADITGEDARARGYIKGNQKVSEVIEGLKRETTPQTIYKYQKLDRDDTIDITDFDVVAWLKAEMRMLLDKEVARAILIGDGRQAGNDKIKELNVRPIYNDADLYTVKVPVNVAANATDNDVAFAVIDSIIRSRKEYKGSGNPSFFVDENYLGILLTLKDGMGRYIYENEASLAARLRVKEIIPVDVMDGQQIPITVESVTSNKPLIGVIVNLQDYNVGADKGGQISFFDDFDLKFNTNEYLIETRMSGALTVPYSAMSVYLNRAS